MRVKYMNLLVNKCLIVTDPPYLDKIFKLLQALQFYYAHSQSTVIHFSHPAKVALLTAVSGTVLLQYLLLSPELLTEGLSFQWWLWFSGKGIALWGIHVSINTFVLLPNHGL